MLQQYDMMIAWQLYFTLLLNDNTAVPLWQSIANSRYKTLIQQKRKQLAEVSPELNRSSRELVSYDSHCVC